MKNGMVKIDKQIAQPPISRGAKPKYPWKNMKVGDSFFAPLKPTSLTGPKHMAEYRTGYKFSWRKVKDGTRVWRIA